MKKTLAAQAVKVRKEFEDIPLTIIQDYRQFFDDVWNLCGTIIEDDPEQETVRRSRRAEHVVVPHVQTLARLDPIQRAVIR